MSDTPTTTVINNPLTLGFFAIGSTPKAGDLKGLMEIHLVDDPVDKKFKPRIRWSEKGIRQVGHCAAFSGLLRSFSNFRPSSSPLTEASIRLKYVASWMLKDTAKQVNVVLDRVSTPEITAHDSGNKMHICLYLPSSMSPETQMMFLEDDTTETRVARFSDACGEARGGESLLHRIMSPLLVGYIVASELVLNKTEWDRAANFSNGRAYRASGGRGAFHYMAVPVGP